MSLTGESSDRSGAVGRMTFRNETMGSRAWIESTPGVSEDGARYRSTRRCAGAPKGSSGPCRNSRAARTDARRTARGHVNRGRRTSRKSAGTIRKRRPGIHHVVEFVILRRRLDELMPVELGDEFLRFGDALLLLQPLQFAFRRDF